MKEVLYAAERSFLERYLKERAQATLDDFKVISEIYGNPISNIPPESEAAIDEIYSLEDNAARIKIEGVLSPEGPDLWDRFWGHKGTSYKTIQAAMERAKNTPAVARVIFDMDSPGGTVTGCDETWQAHKALARVKPTEVRAGSYLASAAYYIASPAHKILAAAPTSEIGSIGVVVATYDWSKYEEDLGIRRVIITSSNAPDKRPDVATEEGRSTIKSQLDSLERIFYARVAEGRGVTAEHIAEHFGRGGLLVANDPSTKHEDAIRSGMIDGLTTDLINAQQETQKWAEAERKEAAAAIEDAMKPGAKFCSADGKELPPEECERIRQSIISMATSPNGETISPAVAGTTQEGHCMDLSEFLKANPAAAAEIEKIKSDALAAGKAEALADYTAKVDRVLPIIQSAEYPANIKAIACNVLAGKEEMAAFTAVVAVFDSNKEAENSAAAQGHSAGLGAVGAEAPDLTRAAEKEIDAAINAEIEKRKVK